MIKSKNLKKKVARFEKLAMAYPRNVYKDKLEHVLAGAAGEFYKCRIHDKVNATNQYRAHWESEWTYHLDAKLMNEMNHEITFRDRRKAVNEVIKIIEGKSPTYMRGAANTMSRYLGESAVKLNKVLNEKDIHDFMEEVKKSCETHLAAIENPNNENE